MDESSSSEQSESSSSKEPSSESSELSSESSSEEASSSSEETSSSSQSPSTSYSDDTYFRLSPTDFSTTIYSLDRSTCTFADSGYTIDIDQDCLTYQEVCYYWMAFRQLPPNYFMTAKNRSDKTSAIAYGVNGRCASKYYVGEYQGSNNYSLKFGDFYDQTTDSYYWELDIDLTGSYNTGSSISRGAGRVVVVERGLEYYGGDGPVCFYTTDHYSTFSEFYNYYDGFGETYSSYAGKPMPQTLSLS